ncbi:hypothetical protein STEG23_023037 [Scotinomys teguina]
MDVCEDDCLPSPILIQISSFPSLVVLHSTHKMTCFSEKAPQGPFGRRPRNIVIRFSSMEVKPRIHRKDIPPDAASPFRQQKGQPQQDSLQQALYWSRFMVDRIDEEQRTQTPSAHCLYTVQHNVSTSDWSSFLLSIRFVFFVFVTTVTLINFFKIQMTEEDRKIQDKDDKNEMCTLYIFTQLWEWAVVVQSQDTTQKKDNTTAANYNDNCK